MNRLKQTLLVFLLLTTNAITVQATDRPKEQRWANQIVDFLIDGEPQWLEADGQKFLGIYTPTAQETPAGGVILLHGRGVHPDWPQVIQPLRTGLPDEGWATLSLQMPVLGNEAEDKDYVPVFDNVPGRIQAGLDFLSQRNIKNIVLIGHSLGTNMATDYLAKHPDPRIKAFVGIGMTGNQQPHAYRVLDNVVALLQVKIPVLDIYGSKTIQPILDSVDRRAYVVYHTGNDYSRQIKLEGANHFFQGYEDILISTITTWMEAFATSEPTNKVVIRNKTAQ